MVDGAATRLSVEPADGEILQSDGALPIQQKRRRRRTFLPLVPALNHHFLGGASPVRRSYRQPEALGKSERASLTRRASRRRTFPFILESHRTPRQLVRQIIRASSARWAAVLRHQRTATSREIQRLTHAVLTAMGRSHGALTRQRTSLRLTRRRWTFVALVNRTPGTSLPK